MNNNEKNGPIILTSTGLSSQQVAERVFALIKDKPSCHIAIIVTAAEGKENNKYSKLAYDQFLQAGFSNIDFVDLEDGPLGTNEYDIVYVCGGNTFKLLQAAKESSFKNSVEELLKKGAIYLGVSAGSILLSPTIEIANEIEPDLNTVGISDLSAFGLIPFHVMPHYSLAVETEVRNFEKNHNTTVHRLSNSQALIVFPDHTEQIG